MSSQDVSGQEQEQPLDTKQVVRAGTVFMHRITYNNPDFFLNFMGTFVPYPWYKSLEEVSSFEAKVDDLCLISFPRSGKNWMSAIIFMIRNVAKPNPLRSDITLSETLPFLEQVVPPAVDNPELRNITKIKAASSPRLYASHLGINAIPTSVLQKAKIIYVIRNPKDVLVSLFNFCRGLRAIGFNEDLNHFVQQFMDRDGKIFFGPYFEHLAGYWQLRQKQGVLIVVYEDLVKNFYETVKRIAKFMETDLSSEQLDLIHRETSFSEMKANPATNREEMQKVFKVLDTEVSHYMRAGKIGSWKETLDDNLCEQLDSWIAENLQRPEFTGLTFEFE